MKATTNKTTNTFQRIPINTGGGDAPGLNAVIHAVVHAAHTHGWENHGIRSGFDGLLHPEHYPDGGVIKLTRPLVRDIAHNSRDEQSRESIQDVSTATRRLGQRN